MDIYDRINVLLKERGITRKELADQTGISYQTLTSLFYRRSGNMSISTIRKIVEYFQISADYLIMGESYMVKEKAEKYLSDTKEIDYEILRISRSLPLRQKSDLLQTAYQLETVAKLQKE